MSSKSTAEKPRQKVVVDYQQTGNHRTVFADGAVGGSNFQQRDMLRVSFYRELMPLPQETMPVLEVDAGTLTVGPTERADIGNEINIVREIDTTLVLTVKTARELSEWLASPVDSIEQASKA